MAHLSEQTKRLGIKHHRIDKDTSTHHGTVDDVCLVILPPFATGEICKEIVLQAIGKLGEMATLVTLGNQAHQLISSQGSMGLNYHHWIAIKRASPQVDPSNTSLPNNHFGALIHTKYKGSLKHTQTRIAYGYCPSCHKTTKNYGGKKHTYNAFGTLMSDVWRDIEASYMDDLSNVIERFADLFGVEGLYKELVVLDFRAQNHEDQSRLSSPPAPPSGAAPQKISLTNSLICGDALEELRALPDNSVDFAFADPPYNLGKTYSGYDDNLSIVNYFEWCDLWLDELVRITKPGRTIAIVNIPLWSVRHALHMQGTKDVQFQNWIVWDALSFPVRKIMPAHYAVVCWTKGQPRPLPCLVDEDVRWDVKSAPQTFHPLKPLGEAYCLRDSCVRLRTVDKVEDRTQLTDLWTDIHRLKHNSRRVDHPCQLPPHFMYRLVQIFTRPGELVLDCFNGAGTTTLVSDVMSRRYRGIEIAEKYHRIAQERHTEISLGLDPFRTREKYRLLEKNSDVSRPPKRRHKTSKKALQLEIRRISQELGRVPTREEVGLHTTYPVDYYECFSSWGEATAAARHEGMTEEAQT